MTDRICVAQIGAAHGVRGEVRLGVHRGSARRHALRRARKRGRHAALRDRGGAAGEGHAGRAAQGRRRSRRRRSADEHAALCGARQAAASRTPDEFYHADLVGLAAMTPDGEPVGTVKAIHNFGAGDLIEIEPASGGATRDVPFTETTVPDVECAGGGSWSTAAGRVCVMWRASVLTIFPGDVSGAAWAEPCRQGAGDGPVVARGDRHPRSRDRQAPHRRRHAGRRRARHGDEGRRAGARASTPCRRDAQPAPADVAARRAADAGARRGARARVPARSSCAAGSRASTSA